MGKKKKFYAVKVGKNPGIYESWDECQEQVYGFIGARHKGFETLEEAQCFMKDIPFVKKEPETLFSLEEIIEDNEQEVSNNPIAYIDGSYDTKTSRYSFGCVLIQRDTVIQFKKAYPEDEYSVHRNVAGEIKGAGFVIQYAINHGIKELDLYYDYVGIEKWFVGAWKASKPISIAYVEFANSVRDKIKINFHKVKSHSNVYYNEMVDRLAKDALGIC